MTDKELIYKFLDKEYKVELASKRFYFVINSRTEENQFRVNDFINVFNKVFSTYQTLEGTSTNIMLNWYKERLRIAKADYKGQEVEINNDLLLLDLFINKDRFYKLVNHKNPHIMRQR